MAAMIPERAGVVRDETTGELIIPASQRPDGTWRKPRRVKDGYIPQEEVPAFETKGTHWAKSRPDHPIGLSPDDVDKMRQSAKAQKQEESSSTTSMSKSAKKNAKRKEKKKQQQAISAPGVNVAAKAISDIQISSPANFSSSKPSQEDIAKKIKNLKKKLRQIEELEAKINSGKIENPEKEQFEKVKKKQSVVDEIEDLELELDDD